VTHANTDTKIFIPKRLKIQCCGESLENENKLVKACASRKQQLKNKAPKVSNTKQARNSTLMNETTSNDGKDNGEQASLQTQNSLLK